MPIASIDHFQQNAKKNTNKIIKIIMLSCFFDVVYRELWYGISWQGGIVAFGN